MSNKKYIDVNIDGTQLDLPADGINLQLTYVNPCSEGFGTISGNKSERSQNYPATKQNDSIFDNWWKVSQENTPTAAEEKDAFINVNGLSIMSGKAQLKSVTTQGRFYERQGKEYSVSFIGDNADWFERLKDKQLGRDLDWTLENHTFDEATILTGYNNAPVNLYAYCLARFKDSTWLDTIGVGFRFDYFDSTPVLFIGAMVNKLFNSIGYTLSSVFWANAVNARYVLPVPLNAKYPQEFSIDYLNVAATKNVTQIISNAVGTNGLFFDTQTLAPAIGANPLVLSTPSTVIPAVGNVAQYTAPYAGFFQFTVKATVNNIIGLTTILGVDFLGPGLSFVAINAVGLVPADNGKTYSFSVVAELEINDVVEVYATARNFPLNIDFASMEIIGEAKAGPGSLIDFKYLLRDWKITDFLKGLTAAFNLCWQTDVDLKIVTCEPKDKYIISSRSTGLATLVDGFHTDNTNDYKSKVDYKKEGKVRAVNNTSEIQLYKWLDDGSDATATALNDNEFTTFDGGRYNMPLNRFKPATEANENPFFAPTVMYFDEGIRGLTSTLVPLLPIFWPHNFKENPTAEENETEYTPRILWFGGQRATGTDGNFQQVNSVTGGITNNVLLPACFFVNYNDPTGLDVSLNWSNLDIQGNTVQGQLQKFYLNELARMRVGKEVEEWIYWDELDIMSLDFGPKIFIDGDMYILKKIDSYSPLIDRTTKTILVYDCPASQEDVNRIENTLAIGFISDYTNPDEA